MSRQLLHFVLNLVQTLRLGWAGIVYVKSECDAHEDTQSEERMTTPMSSASDWNHLTKTDFNPSSTVLA